MKAFLKYSVFLLVALVYLGQRVDVPRAVKTTGEQERVVSNEKEAFEQLVQLTALNGNALPVNTAHDGGSSVPAFRYLPRNNFLFLVEEHEKIFSPYFKYVENDYLDYFALKQDGGYYVFALREILV